MALNCVLFAHEVIRQQSYLNTGSSQCKWTTDHRKIVLGKSTLAHAFPQNRQAVYAYA